MSSVKYEHVIPPPSKPVSVSSSVSVKEERERKDDTREEGIVDNVRKCVDSSSSSSVVVYEGLIYTVTGSPSASVVSVKIPSPPRPRPPSCLFRPPKARALRIGAGVGTACSILIGRKCRTAASRDTKDVPEAKCRTNPPYA